MSGPTDFSGAASFTGATSFNCATLSGVVSDKAIPQSLPPPLQQEDIVDSALLQHSALLQQWYQSQSDTTLLQQLYQSQSDTALLQQLYQSRSDTALLQQLYQWQCSASDDSALWPQFNQSPCSASHSTLLPQELLHGNRYDASVMSGPTDFSGAASFTGATSLNCATLSGPTDFSGAASFTGATRHYESYGTTLVHDEVEEVGTRSEGRGEGEMEEGHLNSAGCLKKGKRKVRSPRGERGNKKTAGVRIEISLDDILKVEQMRLEEAARYLKVSASTLKRVCREHGINRWPPHMGKNRINQSGPSESLLAVDQDGIAQQRPDTPRSSNTNSVIIKARYVNDCTIRFQLSRPWVMVELQQQVQKRLQLEAGTYFIKYRDEENDLIIIGCDQDLQDYISSSRPRVTTCIEVFLVPK